MKETLWLLRSDSTRNILAIVCNIDDAITLKIGYEHRAMGFDPEPTFSIHEATKFQAFKALEQEWREQVLESYSIMAHPK